MEYPNQILEERINKLDVNLIGVTHTEEFFNEYKDFFEKRVANSNEIFIEGPSEIALAHEFYGKLANLAKKRNLPVYIPDPTNFELDILNVAQFIIGYNLIKNNFPKHSEISRRNFLKRIVKLGGGSYLMLGTNPINEIRRAFSKITKFKIDDALLYDITLDYRNILSAENLDKISNKLSSNKPIPYFIGAAHLPGIHKYLENPTLRKKRILYLPQDIIIDDRIKKYEFINNNWELVEKI